MSEPTPVPPADGGTDPGAPAGGVHPARAAARTPASSGLALTLGAALLATAVSWAAGESNAGRFAAKQVADPISMVADPTDSDRAETKNGVLAYGVQGAALGLLLGLAGGLAARSPGRGIFAGVIGLVLGGGAAAGAAFGAFTASFKARDPLDHSLLIPLMAHAGTWGAAGFAAGLALGIGLGGGPGRVAQAALGGLIGAAIGAGLYEVVGAVGFSPVAETDHPVAATAAARAFAHAAANIPAALGAALSLNTRSRRG